METDGRRRRSERTRKQILKGAQGVFMEHGYAGSSMKAIAGASGVTQSLLHHHFGGKQELWSAVQEAGFREVLGAMRPLVSKAVGSPDFPLILFQSYFDTLREHPEYVRLLGWTYVIEPEAERSLPGQATALVGILEKLQREGKLTKALGAAEMLSIIWSLAEGWFLGRKDFIRRLDSQGGEEALIDRYRESALQGLRRMLDPDNRTR